jgi:hypothetical protein
MRTVAILLGLTAIPLSPVAVAAPLPPEARIKPVKEVAGTVWEGDGVVAPTVYYFEKGGVLTYSYNGAAYSNGTWKQDGERIYWEFNERYCEFEGKISGDTISVNAWNVKGGKWELTIKLRPDARPPAADAGGNLPWLQFPGK